MVPWAGGDLGSSLIGFILYCVVSARTVTLCSNTGTQLVSVDSRGVLIVYTAVAGDFRQSKTEQNRVVGVFNILIGLKIKVRVRAKTLSYYLC